MTTHIDLCSQLQPLRTGSLFYLNVHDFNRSPDFEWIQTDARLYSEGLQLSWRRGDGQLTFVILDLESCEGKSS